MSELGKARYRNTFACLGASHFHFFNLIFVVSVLSVLLFLPLHHLFRIFLSSLLLFLSQSYFPQRKRRGGGEGILIRNRDFSAQQKVVKSPEGTGRSRVTIDFACFLSEIALFFLSLPLPPSLPLRLNVLGPSRFGSRRRSIRYRGLHDRLGGPPRARRIGFWD